MIGTFFTSPNFATFIVASLILAITPGPAVIYLLTQTLGHGRKAGLASVGGIALGNLGNASAASVGLAAVFAASSTAFFIVKSAGAAYLIFLGFRILNRSSVEAEARVGGSSPDRRFRDGLIVALFNPKTALFFAALLPQFINPSAAPLWQSLLFGCVFVAIAMCTDTIYVLTASAVATAMRRRAAWQPYGRYVSAASFIGLGIYAAFASPRAAN
jgi:threonine/homoserine/homoserine lactone efflux protein